MRVGREGRIIVGREHGFLVGGDCAAGLVHAAGSVDPNGIHTPLHLVPSDVCIAHAQRSENIKAKTRKQDAKDLQEAT